MRVDSRRGVPVTKNGDPPDPPVSAPLRVVLVELRRAAIIQVNALSAVLGLPKVIQVRPEEEQE